MREIARTMRALAADARFRGFRISIPAHGTGRLVLESVCSSQGRIDFSLVDFIADTVEVQLLCEREGLDLELPGDPVLWF